MLNLFTLSSYFLIYITIYRFIHFGTILNVVMLILKVLLNMWMFTLILMSGILFFFSSITMGKNELFKKMVGGRFYSQKKTY